MAAGTLPKPGTKYGPCAESCAHSDCAETRAMAAAVCHYCEEAIGYDVRFYRSPPIAPGTTLTDTTGTVYGLVHADCAEDAAERSRKSTALIGHHTLVATIRRGHSTTAYVARCSCGWRGGLPRPTEDEAEHDATDHVVAATR